MAKAITKDEMKERLKQAAAQIKELKEAPDFNKERLIASDKELRKASFVIEKKDKQVKDLTAAVDKSTETIRLTSNSAKTEKANRLLAEVELSDLKAKHKKTGGSNNG